MRSKGSVPIERALIGLQVAGAVLAIGAALVWPRPGQAALLVPVGGGDLRQVLEWASRAEAPLIALDSRDRRVIVRITDNRTLIAALRQGILPVAARTRGCIPDSRS